jgi:spore coat protein H
MMLKLRLIACIAVTFAAVASRPVVAQTSEQLFDQSVLHEIRIFINARDLALLREHYTENTQYPADLHWGSVRVPNVAIRSRGFGTRSSKKLGLQIDFAHYASRQRFAGLKSLVLKNLLQDPSMVREPLAMAMFSRMGQPAPREAFCRLYINGIYEGLYVLVEDVDDQFLERTLGSGAGYLFEFHRAAGRFNGEYLGNELGAYRPLFEARTHRLESDAALYGPISDLFRAVAQNTDFAWGSDMARHLDLPQFMTHVAIESFIAENDGILGHTGMNNFYLYRESSWSPHRLVVWDKDNSFLDATMPVLERWDQNEVMRRALMIPELRALFLQTLETCARLAADGWWGAVLNNYAALVDAAAREDSRKPFANEQFDADIAHLRRFIQTRTTFVLEEVERLRDPQ